MSIKKRPILKNIVLDKTSELEKFQNETLRPIIKMQHAIIILFFRNCLQNRKIKKDELQEINFIDIIDNFFTKDNKFRNQLIGVIIGQFTKQEFKFYINFSSEINKRILQITIQRLKNSIKEI